ncbi:MAG TPA: SRPBCC family protein [Dehalococcoidia bacterium]|nr:SRPBCC family protein [Dehalococcoidia bacterium]
MAKVERSIKVNADIDKVFAYISNPANEMEWFASISDIRDIKGQGVGQKYGYTFKLAGLPLKGESEVLEYVPNKRYVTESKGGIKSAWNWTLTPEDGGTLVNVVVEYSIPVPVLGKISEKLAMGQIEREADLAAANIKAILEG